MIRARISNSCGVKPDPMEFADTLRAISEGELPAREMVTGTVRIDGVPEAFTTLSTPEAHAKILVVP